MRIGDHAGDDAAARVADREHDHRQEGPLAERLLAEALGDADVGQPAAEPAKYMIQRT